MRSSSHRLPELAHRREAERFPDGSATEGCVADIGDGDSFCLALNFFVERRAGRNVRASADKRVVRVNAEGNEEGVHAAAHALVEACLAAEDFREQAVEQDKSTASSSSSSVAKTALPLPWPQMEKAVGFCAAFSRRRGGCCRRSRLAMMSWSAPPRSSSILRAGLWR